MVTIVFEFETQCGTFRDALHFEDSEVPDDAAIETMKQERLNNWVRQVENPPPPPSKYQRDEGGNLILDQYGDPIPTEV